MFRNHSCDSHRQERMHPRSESISGHHMDDHPAVEENVSNEQLLFIGSLNCIRHKPYLNITHRMKAATAAILCPTISDFSSGRYLNQIHDAIIELSEERHSKKFTLAFGCQWVILSTDADLLIEQLKKKNDINVTLYDDSHLENGDHH